MNAKATLLANRINNFRNLSQLNPLSADTAVVGAAAYHAAEISKNQEITMVASDGEDLLRRIVCSGGTAGTLTGVIVVGYSTDPNEVFSLLETDYGAFGVINNSNFSLNLSIAYDNGYWVIVLQ